MLRESSVDENGNEHILQFAPEGWIISDLHSFSTDEASSYNIDAMEDAELLLINKSAYEALLKKSSKYETYIRLQLTGGYVAMQKRITALYSLTPEERYTNLLMLYPNIVHRVPQHMIASFMGLKPETLSRIRKKIATNK